MERIKEIYNEIMKIAKTVEDKAKKVEAIAERVAELEKAYADLKEREALKAYNPQGRETLQDVLARPAVTEVEKELHVLADGLLLLKGIDERKARECEVYRRFKSLAMKVINTEDDSDLFPTEYSWSFFKSIFSGPSLLNLFVSYNMRAEVEAFPFPASQATCYLAGQATDITGAIFGTSKPTFSKTMLHAKPFKVAVPISEVALLFARPELVAYLREDVINTVRNGVENAVVNGDPDGDIGDAGVTAEYDVRKAFKGLRALAKGFNTWVDIGSATNAGDIHRVLMKKIAAEYARPENLIYTTSISGYVDLLTMEGVKSVAEYGEKATVVTGELGKLYGVPIVPSLKVPANLNSSGVVASSGTKTAVILFAPKRLILGRKGNVQVKIITKDFEGYSVFLATVYAAFAAHTPSSKAVVAVGYNFGS